MFDRAELRVLSDKHSFTIPVMGRKTRNDELYNADTGEGCDVGKSDRFYPWGGLLTLIAIQEDGK